MKINVKMHDAAVIRPAYSSEIAVKSPGKKSNKLIRKVKEYPNIGFDSRVIPGIKTLTLDSTCQLVIDVEVKGLREPSDWDIREGRYVEGDKIVDFKIINVGMVTKDYKTMGEASDAAIKRLEA